MTGREFGELFSRARAWFERAANDGWLGTTDVARFEALDQATPAGLFVAGGPRPLVVAFFGGTGVGKSSLLNRLAGQPVARVGIERPTSFEVTAYAHEDVQLAELPRGTPVDQVRVVRHSSDVRAGVLWMDMPDIDSTHEENRRCALAWLPYVDVLIYVVSPERYRDDAGWRLLLERGHKHGWIFVINRWDEGDPAQRDDFVGVLRNAGFDDPLVLCTSCADGPAPPSSSTRSDDFHQLEAELSAVLAEHGVLELERLGYRARAIELGRALAAAAARLGDDRVWHTVADALHAPWRTAADAIRDGVELSLGGVAARLAVREPGMFEGFSRRARNAVRGAGGALLSASGVPRLPAAADSAPPTGGADHAGSTAARDDAGPTALLQPGEVAHLLRSFWDDWTQARLQGCLEAVELAAQRSGIPGAPLRNAFDRLNREMRSLVLDAAQRRVAAAMACPSAPWRMRLRAAAHWLSYALPATALVVVGLVVIMRFASAALSPGGAFLSVDFAVHAGLLVLVSWVLPFAAEQALRPRMHRVVLDALRRGLQDGLNTVRAEATAAITATAGRAAALRREADGLLDGLAPFSPPEPPAAMGALRRMIADDVARDRSTGGRAGCLDRRAASE
ncbi:MAG: GTPase domain-containing protein [Phycisphaerae bacterium]|nr:GTPase domain-containing protein [Phycisphaerae bacterium]MCZ2399756.1 GTPase domain-containing protein [Phycisphaerae bacterium]